MTSALRRDVEFQSGGVTCRAWVYSPHEDTSRPQPCIVMAHGLGGTRDAALEPYARRFVEAGFYVLLFDYRYLGASDGEPRQLISITRQLADWAAAIAFARRMPGVDPQRIALWGSSLSGGHVLVAAARDAGIAAISAQCPMLDGAASARITARNTKFATGARLIFAALKDAAGALLGSNPLYVPLVGRPGEVAVMATPDAYAGCQAIVPPGWRNEVAARFLLQMPFYRPLRHAGDVKCPALFISCRRDSLVSTRAAIEAAERMGDKARLVQLPIGHFDVYLGEWFERSSREQVAFFDEVLRG